MTSRSAIKRAGIAAALGLASVLTCASPASAATDIMRAEPFDANKLMLSICNGRTTTSYWRLNVQTGQLVKLTPEQWRLMFNVGSTTLKHPWEAFHGHCSYPKASSWTWNGPESQVSNTLVNCSHRSTLNETVQQGGMTTSTTTHSVTASFGVEWTAIEKVLAFEAGGSYTRSWSYAKSDNWSRSHGITVPPRRKAWFSHRPVMRTVRSNPVFHVHEYRWGNTKVNSWRGRGYKDILSYGAYYDAVGNVLNSDGSPSGQIVARDRGVNSSADCG
ncbi:hypothetical protein [Streptomyces sp. SP18BB07]|uniref:hypothetical protein n=1 Tax=Streptomyces sp. SP18BB07 TaxID=3002522 RepID=UPI002E76F771|nr:hypothetical protein [Streptomyces sp. SP18BB07]MEE1759560.1 hypothetical protein [Streptomyces sp. SP18BB07]